MDYTMFVSEAEYLYRLFPVSCIRKKPGRMSAKLKETVETIALVWLNLCKRNLDNYLFIYGN